MLPERTPPALAVVATASAAMTAVRPRRNMATTPLLSLHAHLERQEDYPRASDTAKWSQDYPFLWRSGHKAITGLGAASPPSSSGQVGSHCHAAEPGGP